MADTVRITRSGSARKDEMTEIMEIAFNRALAGTSAVSQPVLDMIGMSGACYRMFINNLVRMTPNPRYLEVGSWAGSTACSAMDRNILKATCIDNWSLFGGPKEAFLSNVSVVKTPYTDFRFIESDFRAVDIEALGRNNIYLFDGPHERQDQYDGLYLYDKALDDELYFIVDDWNWDAVRRGTLDAIKMAGFTIDYAIDIRTPLSGSHVLNGTPGETGDWHNGYFLSKLSRIDSQQYLDKTAR